MTNLDRLLRVLSASDDRTRLVLDTRDGDVVLLRVHDSDGSGWPGVVYSRCLGLDEEAWREMRLKSWVISRWDPAKVRHLDRAPLREPLEPGTVTWFIVDSGRNHARASVELAAGNALVTWPPEPFADLTKIIDARLERFEPRVGWSTVTLGAEVLN